MGLDGLGQAVLVVRWKDRPPHPVQIRIGVAHDEAQAGPGDLLVLEIMAGIAAGHPAEEIGTTSQKAWSRRRVVAQFFYNNTR